MLSLILANRVVGQLWAVETEQKRYDSNSALLGVDNLERRVGELGSANIFIQAGELLVGAVTLELVYDSTKIKIEGCSLEISDFQGVCSLTQSGLLQVTGIDIEGVSGKSIIASLTIRPLTVGHSEVIITKVKTLANHLGESIAAETQAGTIKGVEAAAAPSLTPTQSPDVTSTQEGGPFTPIPPDQTTDFLTYLPILRK